MSDSVQETKDVDAFNDSRAQKKPSFWKQPSKTKIRDRQF